MKRVVAVCFELECGHVVRMDRWSSSAAAPRRRRCPVCDEGAGTAERMTATVSANAKPCLCCGTPPVPGALYPDWCDACELCDPAGLFGSKDGTRGPPTWDPRCPAHRGAA